MSEHEHEPSIERLTRDLKDAARILSDREARFLVDAYYQMQRHRIRAAHQQRTLADNDEPNVVIGWLNEQGGVLERQIAKALDYHTQGSPVGCWLRSITGIGPVLAAGLLAHIDITRAPTVGHIWRFAGLDPTLKWDHSTKRPWNATLKTLCWKAGESFTKVSNNDADVYGKIYRARKEQETTRNEAGAFAEQAAQSLAAKKFGADTQARKHYEAGKLPPARIHLRAQRVAVKIFLSDLHHVMHETHFGEPPPKPFVISHLGHAHYHGPPNWPLPLGARP